MTPAHPEALGTGRLLSQSAQSPRQPGLLFHSSTERLGGGVGVGDGHDSESENEGGKTTIPEYKPAHTHTN